MRYPLPWEKGGSLKFHFHKRALSEYDRAVWRYLRLIVMKNLPLYYVEDEDIRQFSRFSVPLCRATLIGIIFQLVGLVQKRIACELRGTIGALLHDGRSCGSLHYVGAIASYCSTTTIRVRLGVSVQHTPRLVLLGLSPLGKVDDDSSTVEATRLNAEVHLHCFCNILLFYDRTLDNCCVFFVADNTATNRRIARLSGIPHVSHKLNLEVNRMVENHADLWDTINSVHNSMKAATQLKNAAILLGLQYGLLRNLGLQYVLLRNLRCNPYCRFTFSSNPLQEYCLQAWLSMNGTGVIADTV